MSADSPASGLDAALAQARRIHRVCELFESRFRDGKQPRIEDFLAICCSEDRQSLFHELLALEIELRRERGETLLPSDYHPRFAEFHGAIEVIFAELDLAPANVPPMVGGSSSTPTQAVAGVPSNVAAGDRPGTAKVPDEATGSRPIPPGQERVGDYVLLEEIARGGMGIVYKAQHTSLKRIVALKMILAGSTASPAERARFRREAELAANLDHPNIVPIYEVRDHDGVLFFSMKLVEGGNLARNHAHYAHNPQAIARLMATLARAVDYAHGKGFIHCDLKPSNILIDQQQLPQITDFGLARRTSEDSSLTASGAVLGTPSYMAPEQASGKRGSIGPTTDVYGLGAILYELLTGRPPFRTSTMMETVVQVLERDPIPPHELAGDVPRDLESICLKCLEKMPEDRYPTARALADELERYLQGEVVAATGVVQRLRRWTRREPELVSRAGGLLVVAILTEFNRRMLAPSHSRRLHYQVQGTLLVWAASAFIFQFLWKKGWRTGLLGMLWSMADIAFLTVALYLLNRPESTLFVGYPLLIAGSGLWFRMGLVWFTTVLAIVGYLFLYVGAALDWSKPFPTWANRGDLQYPNIFVACLLLTGFIVARQVKRILALGRYYEHRGGG
ncbi:MAG: serine/threonine protein kinase [Planctomycetaceae bacterium]|nr:serine/threonine protein kinase [Planctomycetaceae bacterium]